MLATIPRTPRREVTASHDPDARAWARELGVSVEAVELYLACELVDLHVDSYIWTRAIGYDVRDRHGLGPLRGRYLGQADLPRLRDARVAGVTFSVTTNPFRTAGGRRRAFWRNLHELTRALESRPDDVTLIHDLASHRAACASGRLAAWLAIQGANALDADLADLERLPASMLRVTLIGFTDSTLGAAAGSRTRAGLTAAGREAVERLDAARVFVDLAHADRRSFFDAAEVHDSALPLMVTHCGVASVYGHERNLDAEQLRAVADTGGVVGVLFKRSLLGDGRVDAGTVADHLLAIVDAVGDEHAALGTDWDGFNVPPDDLRTPRHLPRLVQRLLERGASERTVRRVLGGNALRCLGELRGP